MQKIEQWNPFPNQQEKQGIYCEGLHDDYEGFRVLLTTEEKSAPMLRLSWENALYYQNRDEGYFFNHGDFEGDFDFPHPYYEIKKSELVKKFHHESGSAYEDWEVRHYCIYTCNDCIDVLSVAEPIAEVLGE